MAALDWSREVQTENATALDEGERQCCVRSNLLRIVTRESQFYVQANAALEKNNECCFSSSKQMQLHVLLISQLRT